MSNSHLSRRVKQQHMHQLAEYRDKLRQAPQLRTLFIELTGLCNEHCRHCGSNCGDFKEVNPLSAEEIETLLLQVKEDFDIKNLSLAVTGGEPLLRPDFFEIMGRANEMGYRWGMTSNGTLITEEVARKLADAGMKTISVSVDGLADTHDWFRQKPGSYELTMQGIRNLLAVGTFQHVQITSVIHHSNIHQLEEMYETFSKVGVRSWRVINIEPIGRAKEQPELLLSKQELKKMFRFIEKKRFAGQMEVSYGCSHYLGAKTEREVRKWYFLCNAGVYTASVTHNGDVVACLDIERRPELIQGNIRNTRLKEIWENGFTPFRTNFRTCEKCEKCNHYEFCAGDSFHTWDFDKMEPALCMKGILF